MNWDEAIESAKEELGLTGWVQEWDEVIALAKKYYWEGDSFRHLKKRTLDFAGNKCEICESENKLTAHHIYYGAEEKTLCVCSDCHFFIHDIQKTYGFVMQLTLLYWDNIEYISINLPNLWEMTQKCRTLLRERTHKNKNINIEKQGKKTQEGYKRIWQEEMDKADLELAKTIREMRVRGNKRTK